jgi:P-aminobenzoate N-oxygenase AurF
MRRLYEQAKIDQWNAATDIDWARPLEGDGGLIADDLVEIHGTKFWDRLSPAERVELNRFVTRWRLSTLMHGEHGAMLVCSQLVENVHGQDAKLFQATQVVDEGRHNEVLHRYLALRLDGESYPLAGNVREIFDTLLGTSAWYLKTIGLQLVAETFAVSLFRMLAESSKDEVLRVICRRILQDEARHMGFSMLSLPAVVEEATASERCEMEDFAVWALNRTLRRIFPLAAYEDMGFDRSDIEEIRQLRRQRAAGGDETAFRNLPARSPRRIGPQYAQGGGIDQSCRSGSRSARDLARRRLIFAYAMGPAIGALHGGRLTALGKHLSSRFPGQQGGPHRLAAAESGVDPELSRCAEQRRLFAVLVADIVGYSRLLRRSGHLAAPSPQTPHP